MADRQSVMELVLKGKDQGATGVIKGVKNAVSEFGDAFKSKFTTGMFERAGQMAAEFVAKLPQMAGEMFMLGTQSEAVTNRLEKFAGGTDKAKEYLNAFNEATDRAVPKLEASASAAKMLQMQLVDNADEMGVMAAVAVKLGDQTMSAGQRMSDFAALLANKSTPRLDNFGIASGKVREKVEQLKQAGYDVDQAFKLAVLEEGRKSLEKLGDTSELTASKVERLKTSVENAKVGIGEWMVGTSEQTGALDWLIERMDMLPDTLERITVLWHAASAANKEMGGNILNVGAGIDVFTGQLRAEAIAMSGVIENTEILRYKGTQQLEQQLYIADALGSSQAAMDQYNTALAAQAAAASISAMATIQHREAMEQANVAAGVAAEKYATMAQSLQGATEAQIASAAISELGKLLNEGKISADDYRIAVNETQLTFGLANEASVNLADRLFALTARFGEGGVAATSFDDELGKLIQANETENLQIEKFGTLLSDSAVPMAETMADRVALFTTAEDLSAEAIRNANQVIETNRERLEKAKWATMGADAALTEFSQRIGSLPTVKDVHINVHYHQIGSPGSDIGQRQGGGPAGGLTLVGESGPELMRVPMGSWVYNAQQLRGLVPLHAGGAGGGGPTYQVVNHFGQDSVRSEADVYRLAEEMERSLELRGVRRGIG